MAHKLSGRYPNLVKRPKGKHIHQIYLDRLRQVTDSGQYMQQSLLAKLYDERLSGEPHVKLYVWSAPETCRPTFSEATKTENDYRNVRTGEYFGPSWSTHWFKVQFRLPYEWKCKPRVEFHWDSNSEAMLWTHDGKPLQGLVGGGERTEWIVHPNYSECEREHTIYIEMACNGSFGNPIGGDTSQPPDPNRYFLLAVADLVSVNLDARALFYDFCVIAEAAREFPVDTWEEHHALQVCNEIIEHFIATDGSQDGIRECRDIAQRYLGPDIDSERVFVKKCDTNALVYGIGHCHIDTCWLWPWMETKRKIARSWSNQCDLLDRYPEYRFTASQAQHYKWLEQLYPYAWTRVKEHIKGGKFQPIGSSWVEHDTNLPSGESLVRQFLYGQRFFESRFGERCKTFWLPDAFGYSAQIPQICRLADMTRFFTQKLSWNNMNEFPHTTFNWVGLDGSQVICHIAPCETYNAENRLGEIMRSVANHKSMDQDSTSLLPFGKGDGGGGPTYGMIERLRRCRGLSDTVGLLPKVQIGVSVEDFFDNLQHKVTRREIELVTWYGELYLELHRGTFTSQAKNKRNNRRAEILLHDIEYLATLASIDGRQTYKYPKKDIDMMWESVLVCQFHDCLPGCAIAMCYDDSNALYYELFKTGDKLLKDSLAALGFDDTGGNTAKGDSILLQTLGWKRQLIPAAQGRVSIAQTGRNVYMLKNDDLEVEVTNGVITSLYDVDAKREVVPKGEKASQIVIFDDKPLNRQAWDVEVYHLQSRMELNATESSSTIEDGPQRVSVTTVTNISDKSWIKTTISLKAFSYSACPSLVEVEAEVEWHETMKFLKVEFPTTITNTEAAYETQFGIIRRSTHYNTSWDMAKFEVCCHKWADLSEHGYGVSLLNDSKYGFAVAGNVMRLSLLRAPKAPDLQADMGRHNMKWAIFPHAGPLDERTVKAGFEFNYPARVHKHVNPSSVERLMDAFKLTPDSSPSLVIDTVKRGEDDEDASNGDMPAKKGKHVIVRIYESLGGFSRGTIKFAPVNIIKAWKCTLLEDEVEQLTINKEGLNIELRAFEVASYKFMLCVTG